ncbi:MAG: PQQ-binding-like beta-propeller repeat protein, partial [Halobacteriales archaeon]|nr:PQQ-binding-like beta-propeller repeat protein [Halobacteriales archaeon]
LAIAGDVAYAAGKADGDDAEWVLVGIDLASGETGWRHAIDAQPRSLSVAAGHVYVGTRDGRLLAFA